MTEQPSNAEPETVPPLVTRFSQWMRQHRGVTESTLANYVPLVKEFLTARGDEPAAYDAHRCGRSSWPGQADMVAAVPNRP